MEQKTQYLIFPSILVFYSQGKCFCFFLVHCNISREVSLMKYPPSVSQNLSVYFVKFYWRIVGVGNLKFRNCFNSSWYNQPQNLPSNKQRNGHIQNQQGFKRKYNNIL